MMNFLEPDPNHREIKESVEDLKETERKLESICCGIQTCLTSLQDQVRLDQLDEWLVKLIEDQWRSEQKLQNSWEKFQVDFHQGGFIKAPNHIYIKENL